MKRYKVEYLRIYTNGESKADGKIQDAFSFQDAVSSVIKDFYRLTDKSGIRIELTKVELIGRVKE